MASNSQNIFRMALDFSRWQLPVSHVREGYSLEKSKWYSIFYWLSQFSDLNLINYYASIFYMWFWISICSAIHVLIWYTVIGSSPVYFILYVWRPAFKWAWFCTCIMPCWSFDKLVVLHENYRFRHWNDVTPRRDKMVFNRINWKFTSPVCTCTSSIMHMSCEMYLIV